MAVTRRPNQPTKGLGGAMKAGATRPVGGGSAKTATRPVRRMPGGRRC